MPVAQWILLGTLGTLAVNDVPLPKAVFQTASGCYLAAHHYLAEQGVLSAECVHLSTQRRIRVAALPSFVIEAPKTAPPMPTRNPKR